MVDQRELRRRRLTNEYDELMSISGDIIHVEPLGNTLPYEKYRITFNLRTVISDTPTFRDKTVCILTIPERYPDVVPKIAVEGTSMPQPWHPNWYRSGTWCFGYWSREESLVNYVYRCAKTIQFDAGFTAATTQEAANKDALAFWNANKGKPGIIPSDTKKLPTVDIGTPVISILSRTVPKIKILWNRGN